MTRDEYLKLCNEYDPEKHELWVKYGFARWKPSDYDDPVDTPLWNANDYELRPKQRELGQWLFDNAPDWVDMAVRSPVNGGWHWVGYKWMGGTWDGHDVFVEPEPKGLDHIDCKDSKIRRES